MSGSVDESMIDAMRHQQQSHGEGVADGDIGMDETAADAAAAVAASSMNHHDPDDAEFECSRSEGGDTELYEAAGKIVHDPIHGQINLEPTLLKILDTPQFQRLRDLKQLGCAYMVFPGASHNRFEHCIGVSHLAEQMLVHLRETQPELEVSPHEIMLVKIAGLCHDLGHGPFSHMFEEFVHAANPQSTFRHERMSLQMLEWLLEENQIPFSGEDMQFLRECINPYDNPTQSNPKRFLYDIVANARNSVDVDKFDYLARDCFGEEMQVLTGDGFMFGWEIEQLEKEGKPINYACIDRQSDSIMYTSGRFVSYDGDGEMLEFTHHHEFHRWNGSNDGSENAFQSDPSNGISLQVTREHRMFVQRGRSAAATSGGVPNSTMVTGRNELIDPLPQVVRADELVQPRCVCIDAHCHHRTSMMQFHALASNGLALHPDANAMLMELFAPLNLGPTFNDKHATFLQLYGFWLGTGDNHATTHDTVLHSLHDTNDKSIIFFSRNSADVDFMDEAFKVMGWVEGREWTSSRSTLEGHSQHIRRINIPSCTSLFHKDDSHHNQLELAAIPFPSWISLLSRDQLRLVVRGLQRANHSGAEKKCNEIHTSSTRLRDHLLILLLHAGYTAHFIDNAADSHGNAHSWRIVFSDSADDSKESSFATHPRLVAQRDIHIQLYGGRVWCVRVDHPDHLIFARRARMNECDEIVLASRPVIIGNCHNLGMSTNLKHDRLLRHCRVIDNEICFNSKEVYNIYELFHTRYSLFKQVYSHRVSKAIEYMICDVFHLADPVLHLSAAVDSPKQYAKLTDCILREIETSEDPRLEAARSLIRRIRKRDLYRLVDETVLPVEANKKVLEKVEPKHILDCYPPAREILTEKDLHVQNLKINYAMKDRNPVDSVKFFHKSRLDVSFYIPKHKVSHLIPQHFQERIIRVFVTDTTHEKMSAASDAINHFLRYNNCVSPEPSPVVRSMSSPGTLTTAAPLRGASAFMLNSHSPLITRNEQPKETLPAASTSASASAPPTHGDGDEDEDVGDDGFPLSQGTAATEKHLDADEDEDESVAQIHVEMTPFQGKSESVLSRLMAAGGDTPMAMAVSASASASASASSSSPTRLQQSRATRSRRTNGHTQNPATLTSTTPGQSLLADQPASIRSSASLTTPLHSSFPSAMATPLRPIPSSTYRRDRDAAAASLSASASASTPAAASSISGGATTPRKRTSRSGGSSLTGGLISRTRTPATPAAKIAAAAAASRANTPALNSRGRTNQTPASTRSATSIVRSNTLQPLSKKRKLDHSHSPTPTHHSTTHSPAAAAAAATHTPTLSTPHSNTTPSVALSARRSSPSASASSLTSSSSSTKPKRSTSKTLKY